MCVCARARVCVYVCVCVFVSANMCMCVRSLKFLMCCASIHVRMHIQTHFPIPLLRAYYKCSDDVVDYVIVIIIGNLIDVVVSVLVILKDNKGAASATTSIKHRDPSALISVPNI